MKYPYPGVLTFQHSNRTFRRHLSTEELAKEVQANIEEKWVSEAEWETVVIHSFTLVHKGEQQYRGILEASQNGETVTLGVDVTYDGESFMWKITN